MKNVDRNKVLDVLKMSMWMNLRQFTDSTTLNTTYNSGMTEQMKTFYVNELLQFAEPNFVFKQFAKIVPLPKNSGKAMEIRYLSPFAAVTTDLTEGVTPDATIMDWNSITATLRQIGAFVPMSDLVEMLTYDPVVMEVTKKLGAQAGKSIDTLIRDVVSGGTNVQYVANVASGTATENTERSTINNTATMTVDELFKAAATLKSQDAPTINGDYVAVMHPYVAADLMRTSDWKDIVKYQNAEKIYNGEIGKIGNVRVVETTNAKVWASAGATIGSTSNKYSVFATMVLAQDAYMFTELEGAGLEHIVKQLGYADALNQKGSVGWKSSCLAKRLIEQYMVRIETGCATAPTAAAN